MKEDLVRLCDLEPLLQLWWLLLGDEVQLKHALWLDYISVGIKIKFECQEYVIVRLFLGNHISVVMICLCDLLWHDDHDEVISHLRVVIKWCSHKISIANDYDIKGVSILCPKLSYDE